MNMKTTLVVVTLSLLTITTAMGWTESSLSESHTMRVEKTTFLARAYIYGGYESDRYWNVTPFYVNQIEAHQDDQSCMWYATECTIRPEVLSRYDIVVLTAPDRQLTSSARDLLSRFKAEGGIVIPSTNDAYGRLPDLRQKFASGQLRSKQPVVLTKAESDYLVIFYPDFVRYDDAKKNAEVLHEAYEFYYHLIGDERPLHGNRIWIVFNPFWKDISKDSNPIRMGGDSGIYEGRLVPPEIPFFHELVHVFTASGRTRAAGWVDINGAFSEALANLFSYYLAVHELKYDEVSPDKLRRNGMPVRWLQGIRDYESRRVDPYSLDWGPHRSAQPYLEAMLYSISEKHGWSTWNWLFKIARASRAPAIPSAKQETFEDLGHKEASLWFSRFVYLLSLAAGEDLRPQFKSWRFKIEPEVEALKVYRVTSLTVGVSSTSIIVGDMLTVTVDLKDAESNPIANQTVSLLLRRQGEIRLIANLTTDASGHAEVSFKVDVKPGTFVVEASYDGTLKYGQRVSRAGPVFVSPPSTTTTLPVTTSTVEATPTTATPLMQTPVLLGDRLLLAAIVVTIVIAVVSLRRRLEASGTLSDKPS